jgi:hypothetical protein
MITAIISQFLGVRSISMGELQGLTRKDLLMFTHVICSKIYFFVAAELRPQFLISNWLEAFLGSYYVDLSTEHLTTSQE